MVSFERQCFEQIREKMMGWTPRIVLTMIEYTLKHIKACFVWFQLLHRCVLSMLFIIKTKNKTKNKTRNKKSVHTLYAVQFPVIFLDKLTCARRLAGSDRYLLYAAACASLWHLSKNYDIKSSLCIGRVSPRHSHQLYAPSA